MKEKELLLADLEHFGNAMMHNEDVGEKRFSFTIALMTAVGSGLVALHTATERPLRADLDLVTASALLALIVFAVLGYFRMLQRNRVTDQYKKTLREIRDAYLRAVGSEIAYHVPWTASDRRRLPFRGGYAETFGILIGVLVGLFLSMFWPRDPLIGGVTGAAIAFWLVFRAVIDRGDKGPAEYFRAGAGALILNGEGRVLGLERRDRRGSWQFPQGGLDRNENALEAAFREIEEETGIAKSKLEMIAEWPEPLVYELPSQSRSWKTGRGQVQYWFVFRAKEAFDLQVKSDEFVASRWMTLVGDRRPGPGLQEAGLPAPGEGPGHSDLRPVGRSIGLSLEFAAPLCPLPGGNCTPVEPGSARFFSGKPDRGGRVLPARDTPCQ
ncbi:MAG: NUDIX domain-containing protein [Thermoanaerobaculia bacterium]